MISIFPIQTNNWLLYPDHLHLRRISITFPSTRQSLDTSGIIGYAILARQNREDNEVTEQGSKGNGLMNGLDEKDTYYSWGAPVGY